MTPFPPVELLSDFLPLAQRALEIDPASPMRLRSDADTVSAYVRLPYDVLAGRTIAAEAVAPLDATVEVFAFVDWLEGRDGVPPRRDALWLTPLPPRTGWQRIELVPDHDIRQVVRSGAMLARDVTTRASQESLLASQVLHASSHEASVDVPLGALSALTRMGFLPRDSQAAVDVAPGWIRVAAAYGSTFVATAHNPLGMLSLR